MPLLLPTAHVALQVLDMYQTRLKTEKNGQPREEVKTVHLERECLFDISKYGPQRDLYCYHEGLDGEPVLAQLYMGPPEAAGAGTSQQSQSLKLVPYCSRYSLQGSMDAMSCREDVIGDVVGHTKGESQRSYLDNAHRGRAVLPDGTTGYMLPYEQADAFERSSENRDVTSPLCTDNMCSLRSTNKVGTLPTSCTVDFELVHSVLGMGHAEQLVHLASRFALDSTSTGQYNHGPCVQLRLDGFANFGQVVHRFSDGVLVDVTPAATVAWMQQAMTQLHQAQGILEPPAKIIRLHGTAQVAGCFLRPLRATSASLLPWGQPLSYEGQEERFRSVVCASPEGLTLVLDDKSIRPQLREDCKRGKREAAKTAAVARRQAMSVPVTGLSTPAPVTPLGSEGAPFAPPPSLPAILVPRSETPTTRNGEPEQMQWTQLRQEFAEFKQRAEERDRQLLDLMALMAAGQQHAAAPPAAAAAPPAPPAPATTPRNAEGMPCELPCCLDVTGKNNGLCTPTGTWMNIAFHARCYKTGGATYKAEALVHHDTLVQLRDTEGPTGVNGNPEHYSRMTAEELRQFKRISSDNEMKTLCRWWPQTQQAPVVKRAGKRARQEVVAPTHKRQARHKGDGLANCVCCKLQHVCSV
jgi:hypothetical protein